ncbi:50S ribosomal protein L9 [Halobacteriovorax marinus]|uniref:Large ribosomal subunit protein bL9 n=1 Tax=Halobacteriovorax marinus (strain ATCC BAA-682 / DSM 15412 / SJ) TaxID=862908 RepID=E1WXH1_HALMS|nr:50S ribosomal protein L9 [Halobacteriovorax marinus]ATH08790.1 50S ribosomal protein L9 [Halobacteriovorax marinus]CBW27488.1 50S ribosomal protein L9 [Halobacteriovorax marinus SJ]
MKVILTERVKTLGNVGEIVNVSQGYARNYLLPNRFAVLADESNTKQLNHQQKVLAKKMEEQKATAVASAKKVEGITLEFVRRVAGSGKLFGTVSNLEIAKELEAQGVEVEKRMIVVANPIKAIGNFDVTAKLFEGVEANFKVNVTLDPAQAEEMKKKQEDADRKKAAAAEAAALAKENGETEEATSEVKELTEEEKLKEEANKILRS